MCDYSLQHVASRAARVGDQLTTTKFGNSITRGFAEVGEPSVAVCVLPGTEIAFDKKVQYYAGPAMVIKRSVRATTARFRQIDLEDPYKHHDALEFPSGQVVLLTRLCEGQRATVLQLPADPQALTGREREAAAESQSRVPVRA